MSVSKFENCQLCVSPCVCARVGMCVWVYLFTCMHFLYISFLFFIYFCGGWGGNTYLYSFCVPARISKNSAAGRYVCMCVCACVCVCVSERLCMHARCQHLCACLYVWALGGETESEGVYFWVACSFILGGDCSTHTARHCNTLQCTATHCNKLQHTAPHCTTL